MCKFIQECFQETHTEGSEDHRMGLKVKLVPRDSAETMGALDLA